MSKNSHSNKNFKDKKREIAKKACAMILIQTRLPASENNLEFHAISLQDDKKDANDPLNKIINYS